MRYPENRDASAALLRLAIAELGQHDAPPHPFSYAVWYEHVAGSNPRLSQALAKALVQEPRLSDATVRRLHEDHVADVDESTAERIGNELQRLLQAMGESAAHTGRTADSFGNRLDGLARTLAQPDVAPQLLPALSQALAHTAEMRRSVQGLQQQLASTQDEMAQLRESLKRSREDALIDPLTRIANRRAFDQALALLLEHPPEPGCHHVLALFDLDHFKRVNDDHGHLVGDSVLQGVGEILRRTAQAEGVHCARYGGEEFALLMRDRALPAALQLVESVRALVGAMTVRHRSTREVLATITVSAGVAACQDCSSVTDLLASADEALYRAKQAGRDRVVVG